MANQQMNTKENQDKIDENSIQSPIEQRIEILQDSTSTSEKFKLISNKILRKKIAQTSLECEKNASESVTEIQYFKNIEELKSLIIFKGEEQLELPNLPIVEMKLEDTRTSKIEDIKFGLDAFLTNHRLVIIDISSSSYPELDVTRMNNNLFYPSNIEVTHTVSSSLTYYPISLSEILGITCDVQSGTKTTAQIKEVPLFPLTFVFLILGIILGAASNWWLMLISIIGIPFIFLKYPKRESMYSSPSQKKQLKLAVINPENKRLSKLVLEIPEEYSVDKLLLWIKEIQRRSPLLHEQSELIKNININIS